VGKQRRKFEVGFKRQIVEDVETGVLTVSAASRKYQISSSVIDRWRHKAKKGGLQAGPSVAAACFRVSPCSVPLKNDPKLVQPWNIS
jgi:transposase-like protein